MGDYRAASEPLFTRFSEGRDGIAFHSVVDQPGLHSRDIAVVALDPDLPFRHVITQQDLLTSEIK